MKKENRPKHAKLPPSSAHRWLGCPLAAWLHLKGKMPEGKSTEAAEIGTAKHTVAEHWLKQYRAGAGVGEIFAWWHHTADKPLVQGHPVSVSHRELEYIGAAIEYACGHGPVAGEKRLDIDLCSKDGKHLATYGTADLVAAGQYTLHVIDYKFGVTPVLPGSPQLRLYAMGAYQMATAKGMDIKAVTTYVVQPALGLGIEDAYGRCKYTADELEEPVVVPVSLAASAPPIAIAGKQCRWCPMEGVCRAKKVYEAKNITDFLPPAPDVNVMAGCKLSKLLEDSYSKPESLLPPELYYKRREAVA